ncbi:hypothetical protein KQI22_13625, partial [Kineothrix sp. MSJ-39]|uniref:hypothetical protein n=1 Tax=Kineothrix sp. MSJ-39 TaxID=2841533 RepID=UPI001C11C076
LSILFSACSTKALILLDLLNGLQVTYIFKLEFSGYEVASMSSFLMILSTTNKTSFVFFMKALSFSQNPLQ